MNANIEALVRRIEDRMTNSCPSCASYQENEQNESVVCDSCHILMKDFRATITEQAEQTATWLRWALTIIKRDAPQVVDSWQFEQASKVAGSDEPTPSTD